MSKKSSQSSISNKLHMSKKSLSEKSKSKHSQQAKSQNSRQQSSQSQQLTHQHVMQQAIQKASCLIQLLTRQNSQSKCTIEELNEQLAKVKDQNLQAKQRNFQISQKLQRSQQQNQNLSKQLEELLFELQKVKINIKDHSSSHFLLEQSRQKNKRLYEKIADLNANKLELAKQHEKSIKQFKSLENQNLYLLKQLQKTEQKENLYQHDINRQQNQFRAKLSDVDRTKQAFARRTQELKQQNIDLYMELQILKKQKYELQIISSQSIRTLDAVTQKLDLYRYLEQRICKTYDKIKLTGSQNVTRHSLSVNEKMQQIQRLIGYRFQHIQTLMKSICEKLQRPDWKQNLRQLNQTHFIVQRLSNYLNELSTGAGMKNK